MRAELLALPAAAFLLLGVGGWLLGMPPADPVVVALPAVLDANTRQPADDASASLGTVAGATETTTRTVASTARVDETWLASTSATTGIPARVLQAYALATYRVDQDEPGCHLGWNTLAAIGLVESGHASHDGAVLGDDGTTTPAILGPVLDGTNAVAAVPDSDDGSLDGDPTWDRAVGPMQFLPSTWAAYGADGDGDGAANPFDVDDAALGAARYLCAAGGDLSAADGWTRAVLAYNRDDAYVQTVRDQAAHYAARVAGR